MRLWCFLFLLVFISGCMEIAEVSVGPEDPKIVVDGGIYDGEGPFYITLSSSTQLNSPSVSFIENATVTISDDTGQHEILHYEGEGRYRSDELTGTPGHTYYLHIEYEGAIFEASVTMPEIPEVETIETKYFAESFLREEGHYILLNGLDIHEHSGYYRALIYKKDSLYNPLGTVDIFVAISNDSEEGKNVLELPFAFEEGDLIDVHVIKMDRIAYEYYLKWALTFSNIGLFEQVPGNPVSNVSNGALGLFKVQSVRKLQVLVE